MLTPRLSRTCFCFLPFEDLGFAGVFVFFFDPDSHETHERHEIKVVNYFCGFCVFRGRSSDSCRPFQPSRQRRQACTTLSGTWSGNCHLGNGERSIWSYDIANGPAICKPFRQRALYSISRFYCDAIMSILAVWSVTLTVSGANVQPLDSTLIV